MGSAPFLGGGFGHFYAYAPVKIQYAIDRYAMETKRQYDVLDRHFAEHRFAAGDEYSIADMAIWPWYGAVALGQAYGDAASFLSLKDYRHFNRWADEVGARPAVQRGRRVNRNRPRKIRRFPRTAQRRRPGLGPGAQPRRKSRYFMDRSLK